MNIIILYFAFAALYGFITTFIERNGCDQYTERTAAAIGWPPQKLFNVMVVILAIIWPISLVSDISFYLGKNH